jgi:ketosteroid isomerase-like protein
MTANGTDPDEALRTLEAAVALHDLDALVECFAVDYVNETPAHPARGFRGRDQVRDNWRQIFAAVPDLRARVVRSAVRGSEVWSTWEMAGTRRDGRPHLMRGVVIFDTAEGRMTAARFYLEPVDESPAGVDEAVRAAVGVAP